MDIDPDTWARLQPETQATIDRACLSKNALGRDAARRVCEEARRVGNHLQAYRCPFFEDGHWHVGHVPSMASVDLIARAIRDLSGNLPTSRVDNVPEAG